MTTTPPEDRDARLAAFSARIESVQDALRRVPKTPALKDVCAQFAAGLRSVFPAAAVAIGHRADGAPGWDMIVATSGASAQAFSFVGPSAFTGPSAAACDIHESTDGVALIQRLPDDSRVGVHVAMEAPVDGFSEFDIASLRLFLQMFEGAYQEMLARKNEKGLVFSMNHRILQLNSLIDTGIEVASLDFAASPHKLALARAASLANAARGVVRRSAGGRELEAHTFPEGATVPSGGTHRIASSFTFGEDTYEFELFHKESRAGIVAFDDTDQLLLDALARQVQAAIENRDLHRQALDNQKLEQEMTVAASIQQKIIPVSLPQIPGYDIAGKNIPSKSIGGDYYDCIPLRNGSYALVIADVTGKGIPAALLVSSLHAYLSAYLEGEQALAHLVSRLNTMLFRASTPDKFVTAFIAILDPATGELECVNAGHNPTYILGTDGRVRELRFGGLPLASFDLGIPYESERATLAKGERLLLYTDGVTEAENDRHELYEHEVELQKFMAQHSGDTAEAFIARLIADVRRFAGGAPQSDDITALYLHRLP